MAVVEVVVGTAGPRAVVVVLFALGGGSFFPLDDCGNGLDLDWDGVGVVVVVVPLVWF